MLLYDAITLILSVIAGPLFALSPRGRARLAERYGRWRLPASLTGRPVIWFHGASVGELNGLRPVVERMRKAFPSHAIVISSTSPGGADFAAALGDAAFVLPFDNPVWLRSVLRKLQPQRFVLTETELWPALLKLLAQSGTPIYMVNAVISDYSAPRYRFLRPMLRAVFPQVRKILCVDRKSMQRFLELGASPAAVLLCGNSKYEVHPSISTAGERDQLHARFFGNARPVVVLGSLRPGEERRWFPALAEYVNRLNFVVAPRHKEKFDYFAGRLAEAQITFARWSEDNQTPRTDRAVMLLDAMGVLEKVYSFAALAFVGGTLEDWGGHNPLEPAAYGVAPVVGPHITKIRDVVERLSDADACFRVTSEDDCRKLLERLCHETTSIAASGARARVVWEEFSGAAERITAAIMEEG